MSQQPAPMGWDPGHHPPPTFGLSWTQPAPAPRTARVILTVLPIIVVLALIITLGVSRGQRFGAEPTPSSGSRIASPSAIEERLLVRNPIYPLKLRGRCPGASATSDEAAYRRQVSALLECLAAAYKPLVEEAGFDFRPVKHTHFNASVETPCGRTEDEFAFYCESNSTIYFSRQVFESADQARLATADTVIHEYAHHVQSMVEIFAHSESLSPRAVTVRREELQAFCWTYYAFTAIDGFDPDPDDRVMFSRIFANTDDPDGHGSVAAQQYWGPRGLAAGSLGACNTWSVPAETVR
jgi:hypothetical protein